VTPGEVALAARQRTNSVGDTFYSDAELYGYIWDAQNVLAREAFVIERTYTASTVASQREYTYPTSTIAVKRVEYNGTKLATITFREDDQLSLFNSTTQATGNPAFYALWNFTLYLRPVPVEVGTLTIYSYNEAQEVTNSSTLEVPDLYHHDLVTYLCARMAEKNQNWDAADRYQDRWDKAVMKAKAFQRRRLRGDAFTAVTDSENQTTIVGQL